MPRIKLHPKQTLALETPATEVLYGGAAGGGKSFLLRVIAISYCLAVPGIQVYITRRLSDDLKDNHLYGEAGLLALLHDIPGVSINEQQGTCRFSNGAMIHLTHCQHEKDKHKYQGKEIHVWLPDELTHFTESQYTFIRSRLRRGENLKTDLLLPRIIGSANPGGVGHEWVRRTFVRFGEEFKTYKCSKEQGGMIRQFIPAKLEDNPSLDTEEYEGQLYGMGDDALVRAMRHGDWDIVSGAYFGDLWDMERRKNIILQPFRIPDNWEVNRSYDWGDASPFSVGWWAESNGEEVVMADGSTRSFYPGSKIRIHEWYGATENHKGIHMLAKDVAAGIKEIESHFPFKVQPGPADSSIYNTTNGMNIGRDMEAVGVYWTEADKSKGSRVNGWQIMRQMFGEAHKYPMEQPGMFTFSHCLNFIDQIPVLPRDEKNPEDVDTESLDHIGDETRYQALMPRHKTTQRAA